MTRQCQDAILAYRLEGLTGRAESTSYAPEPGHPNYKPMLDDLAALFQVYQANGRLCYE